MKKINIENNEKLYLMILRVLFQSILGHSC